MKLHGSFLIVVTGAHGVVVGAVVAAVGAVVAAVVAAVYKSIGCKIATGWENGTMVVL